MCYLARTACLTNTRILVALLCAWPQHQQTFQFMDIVMQTYAMISHLIDIIQRYVAFLTHMGGDPVGVLGSAPPPLAGCAGVHLHVDPHFRIQAKLCLCSFWYKIFTNAQKYNVTSCVKQSLSSPNMTATIKTLLNSIYQRLAIIFNEHSVLHSWWCYIFEHWYQNENESWKK